MELQDYILKSFSDTINDSGGSDNKDTRSTYATVVKEGDELFVKFDGSEINTPAIATVECGNGDRVLAYIKDHTAVITGNISYPSLTRKGPVYMTLTSEGLVIGILDDNNNPTSYHVLVTNSDLEVIDTNGDVVARFGTKGQVGKTNGIYTVMTDTGFKVIDGRNGREEVIARFENTAQIGKTDKPHTNITGTRFEIRNASNELVGYFGDGNARVGKYSDMHLDLTSSGMELLKNSTSLAKFTADMVSLAKGLAQFSSNLIKLGDTGNAKIQMCGGNGNIEYSNSKLKISGGSNTSAVGISDTHGNYTSELVARADSSYKQAGVQVLYGSDTRSSVIADDETVRVSTFNSNPMYVNNYPVITANDIIKTGSITSTTGRISSKSRKSISFTISPGSGYTLAGLSYVFCGYSGSGSDIVIIVPIGGDGDGTVTNSPTLHGWIIDGNTVTVYVSNPYDYAIDANLRVGWFAVRSSGAVSGGSSQISW